MNRLLEVSGLTVRSCGSYLLRDVSISVSSHETVAFIGESGSGKTMTLKSVLGILPDDTEKTEGSVMLNGYDIYSLKEREKRHLLGSSVGFVPQNTINYLHPLLRISDQMTDGYIAFHGRGSRRDAENKAAELLVRVGIEDAGRVLSSYPSELSGGMIQRVNIASALMMDPSILITDEPTSALDRIIQKQVADLYLSLVEEKHLALIIVSHDLMLVKRIADKIAVFYSGRVVETGTASDIFSSAAHPYTKALISLTPSVSIDKAKPLEEIMGYMKEEDRLTDGCSFASRCPFCIAECMKCDKSLRLSDTHSVRCIRAKELL